MSVPYRVRRAVADDVETIVAFTADEARESEGIAPDRSTIARGVAAAFAEPARALYWVAESLDGAVVAHSSIVTEWSDFHGADYWWVQSLYIEPAHRGTGLVGLLLDTLADAARAAGTRDLRLYAHEGNARALQAYARNGFLRAPYAIMTREL
ncbi:MAG: GNAT family N-acetyltransferase [Gemmatimonadaceae bacterium]|nr:GNAT family N-acetyltransferase [Gemmatimonadaceae bacterium]